MQAQFSDLELMDKAGTQGVELLMWLAMRGALTTAWAGIPTVALGYSKKYPVKTKYEV